MKQLALTVLLVLAVIRPIDAQDAQTPVYLPAGSVDAEALIGRPAERGSAAYREQMTVVLWLQRTRTPEQVAFVRRDLDLERFAPLLADALVAVDGIELKQTLDDVIDQVRTDYDAVKAVYDEPRPFQVNDDVHPATDARPVASYPSGHAIRAVVYARLLGEIFPDHKDALLELAMQVGYGRVIAGVHFPMDVLAGQKLGNAYADVIVAQQAFAEAVQRIRGEDQPSRVAAGQ